MSRVVAGFLTVLVVLAAAVALLGGGDDAAGGPASGSTLEATFADRDGDGVLERAPGEPLLDRTDLAPAAAPGRTLAVLAQISDAHVRDEESPGRAFLLDRTGAPFTSTFRPQEALTPQVLDAAVASVNDLSPQAVLVTGDVVDSAQRNELDQAIAVLRGGRVDPDSGARGYDGPQDAANADPFFYRPDVDAPQHPGLLDRAQLPFRSPGLRAPWLPVAGNHDLLVQGEAPASASVERLTLGSRAPLELGPAPDVPRVSGALTSALLERVLGQGFPGETAPTEADPRRAHPAPAEVLGTLRRGSGAAGGVGRLDYAYDVGPRLRVIALDLVKRGGGSDGRITAEQLVWLERRLARAGRRWIVVASHQSLASSEGGGRALGVLDSSPRVLAAVSGHTHTSSIEPRRSAAGGYWLIGTPSLVDYPQQARALRLVETEGGGVAIETWMLDTAPGELPDTARDLAYLDAQGGRPQGAAGGREDRNVRLYR